MASLGRNAVALVVLAVAAWLLLRIVIGTVTAVATTVAVVVLVLAVIWAVMTLRR
jgi:hypothetical protein